MLIKFDTKDLLDIEPGGKIHNKKPPKKKAEKDLSQKSWNEKRRERQQRKWGDA